MASLQAKIVWKRPRKGENKNYRFVSFRSFLKHNLNFQKNCKKIKKIKKSHFGLILSQNSSEKNEKVRK